MPINSNLTSKRREALNQLQLGWQMLVQIRRKNASPKAYLVRRSEMGLCQEEPIAFSIVMGLEKAKLISLFRPSSDNLNWEYRLAEANPVGH